ncbi:uncharacterized protein LOC113565113 [Drosophila persimilis]|uniref:uncharacterized protein LOC113565113 n=1 Tax=Drosophila persimilis TaxID=7234 RepID=UPI000F079779|nr:uncharacterized protein LOC113565113 [Drosophila persimilis]
MRSQEVYRNLTQPPEAPGPPPEPAPEEYGDDSCPHCDAAPMVGKRHSRLSWWQKLRASLSPLYCFRFRYKTIFKCRSCGWRTSSPSFSKRCSYECKKTTGIAS